VCRYTTRSIRSYSIQNWLKMSSHSSDIQFKSILHQVLKMTPFCSYTGGESRTPLTDLLLRLCRFVQCCATHSTGADIARRRHLRVSRRPALALQPRSYNARGSYLGCLGPLVGRNLSQSYHKNKRVSFFCGPRCRLSVDVSVRVRRVWQTAKLMLNNVGT